MHVSGVGVNYFVLDLSSINDFYNGYSKTNLTQSGFVNAVYFNKDQESYKNQNNGFDLYEKIVDPQNGVINNVYFDGIRASDNGYKMNQGQATSNKARTLKEFEYYGNNGNYEKSAYDSYKDDEEAFSKLSQESQKSLEEDHNYMKQIASVDFIDPDAKKIIFSIVKDREYNV